MYIRNKYHITFTPLYLRYRCAEEQTRRESFLAVNKLCKLATESYVSCVVQVTLFVWRFLDDEELCFFLYCKNFFRILKTKILYYIFMTIFIFYGALKKSRVFLFHLIQLLINFEKLRNSTAATFHFNTGTSLQKYTSCFLLKAY